MQSKKKIIIAVLSVFVVIISSVFTYGPAKLWDTLIHGTDLEAYSIGAVQSSAAAKQDLSVHFIDVDQGDSTLIHFDQYNILIDCAKKAYASNVINYLDSFGADHLDMVIATHPDADHIGGFSDLFYQIKPDVYLLPQLPDSIKRTQTELTILSTLKTLNIKREYAVNGKAYQFGDMKLTTYVSQKEHEDKNDYSIVTKVEYKNASYLFMGDAGKAVEKELMNNGVDLHADVLKAGHHGSSKSTSEKFIKTVQPKYCVFSCGAGNDYGHPHSEVLQLMNQYGIIYYRTDQNANVVIGTDGSRFFTATEK